GHRGPQRLADDGVRRGRVQAQGQLADRREHPVVVDHLMGEELLARALDLPRDGEHGTRSRVAEATPFSTAVDPGPSVDRQTPGRPDVIAAASAMNAAVPSRTADTTWTPRCLAASMKSRIDSPG